MYDCKQVMLEKEIAVPIDAVQPITKEKDVPSPITPKGYVWTERNRQMMREDMVSWPRDARGRWQKKGTP